MPALATAIMSEYISQVCVECAQILSTVPPSVFLISLAAGIIGLVALVSVQDLTTFKPAS